MDSDPTHGTHASEPVPGDSIRDSVAFFVRSIELRLQLFGLEARETGLHLLVLALLVVSTIICFVGFVAMLIVFLLYLMMLTLHWEWGWTPHPGVDEESSVGMDQWCRHFRVAPVSRTRPQKEDLHLQIKSRAGQKPWQPAFWQTLERGLEELQIATYFAKKLAEKAKMPGSKWL